MATIVKKNIARFECTKQLKIDVEHAAPNHRIADRVNVSTGCRINRSDFSIVVEIANRLPHEHGGVSTTNLNDARRF